MAVIWVLTLVSCGDDGGAHDSGSEGGLPDVGVDAPGDAAADGPVDASLDGTIDADGAVAPPARDRLMYVSVGGERRLAVVELSATGTMTAMPSMGLTLPGNPGAMAYAREARRLYIGVGRNIVTVALDAAGAPSLLGGTMETGRSVYLAVAQDDAVLVSAYFGDDRLKTHDISGAPPHREVQSLAVSDEPHAALIGPTGDRVYVPHRGGDRTQWFDLGLDGSLSFGGELMAAPGVGPRHISFRPDGAFAFVINEYADSVTALALGADGALSALETISTLPGGFDGESNTGADIHVSPDGRYLYASNRGHESLAMFAVGAGGSLALLGQIETEERPREFDVSPDGRFVVAAGQTSGHLQSYRIGGDGRLVMVDRLAVGADLRWVIID